MSLNFKVNISQIKRRKKQKVDLVHHPKKSVKVIKRVKPPTEAFEADFTSHHSRKEGH